jgi:hypothetical protein
VSFRVKMKVPKLQIPRALGHSVLATLKRLPFIFLRERDTSQKKKGKNICRQEIRVSFRVKMKAPKLQIPLALGIYMQFTFIKYNL